MKFDIDISRGQVSTNHEKAACDYFNFFFFAPHLYLLVFKAPARSQDVAVISNFFRASQTHLLVTRSNINARVMCLPQYKNNNNKTRVETRVNETWLAREIVRHNCQFSLQLRRIIFSFFFCLLIYLRHKALKYHLFFALIVFYHK